MGEIKSFSERSRDFEEAHKSCRQLIVGQLDRVENYVSKWILVGLGLIFLIQIAGFSYFYYKLANTNLMVEKRLIDVKKKVDHRYFLTKETLEDLHKVRIENGKVVQDFKN